MENHKLQKNAWLYRFSAILIMFFIQVGFASDSNQLKYKIENALAAEGYRDIRVEVQDKNAVRLVGTVDLLYDRLRVFDIAAKFPEVHKVTDAVIVNAPSIPDDMIKANVIDMFNLVKGIPDPDDIKIEVENGVVQLLGKVDMYKTKLLAETATSWAEGVKGIVNDLEIKPHAEVITDENLEKLIGDIIENWYSLEKGSVKYTVEKGRVILTGEVSSYWARREMAKDIAKMVGVKEVVNQLRVTDSSL